MSDKLLIAHGSGGSSSSSQAYVPVESANSTGANTYAKLVDLLCEGEISGPAVDDDWLKSTYFNEIPIKNDDDSLNFSGVTIEGRNGTEDQDYIEGFDGVENTYQVSTAVTVAGGAVSHTITDTNVDSAKVTISIPTLMLQKDNGDLTATELKVRVSVTPENGAGTKQTAVDPETTGRIYGKYTVDYRKQFTIENLSQYGVGPWVITVERETPDSESVKKVDAFSWYSYTTVIDTKLRYYGRAVVGVTLNSIQFGTNIPSRAYRVNGRKIKIPSNYDPVHHTYDGDWDGTFVVATSSNPAWIVYDLLTDPEVGMGLVISESMVDKWELYACGVYCDGQVTVTTREKQTDGTYIETETNEPRFTFNGVIEAPSQALEVIVHMCSAMRAVPIWVGGQVSFMQDRPIVAPARPVSISNVGEEGFEYEGIPRRNHNNVVKVSWNNPELLGKLDVIELVDEESIIQHGYNDMDFVAMGCNSRTEAIRRGNYVLDTDVNARETVSFIGGLEWADCYPGELLVLQDPNYASTVLEGRVKQGISTTSLQLDKEIDIEPGVTYTMFIQISDAAAEERELNNSAGTTDIFTWDTPLPETPFLGAVLVLSASNLAVRKFVVMNIRENDGSYQVTAIEYDADKYARIDSGTVGEQPPTTALLPNVLSGPSNIDLEGYTYTIGDQGVRMYGIQISWIHSLDPRALKYELRYRGTNGGWEYLDETINNNYDWRDVVGDIYDIGVRAVGVGLYSEWLTYTDFELSTALTNLAPPTNLQTKDGSGLWNGRDCTITWTPSTGSQYSSSYDDDVGDSNVSYYKVEVRKADTTLLRAFDTAPGAVEYTYTYEDNVNDNSTPLRFLLFYVYSVDVFGQSSTTYATLAASNPAPNLSSATPIITDKYNYLEVSWTPSTDKDISHYKVYLDSNNPPTTVKKTVNHPDAKYDAKGLDYGTDYFAQIEPYDAFGVGTKSQVSDGGNILKIPGVNLDAELEGSITITDSDGNSAAQTLKLYNGLLSSYGVSYILVASDKYIQYEYGIKNYFDRIGIWTADSNAKVYIAYSEDGTTWNYLCAQSDHTLNNDVLDVATNQAGAKTNYWQLSTGNNTALFPNNVVAKYVRLWLTGSGYTTTIYEIVPSRILISELAAIKHLSSYSANLGIITAGFMQSPDGEMSINLDDKEIYIVGDSGEDLFSYDSNGMFMRGNLDIIGQSTITDGYLRAVDSGTGDYAELAPGKIGLYYWDGSDYQEYQILNRREVGIAEHGDTVTIPGIWKDTPTVILSPNKFQTYNPAQSGFAQEMVLNVLDLQETSLGSREWQFDVESYLQTISTSDISNEVIVSATRPYTSGSTATTLDTEILEIDVGITLVNIAGQYFWYLQQDGGGYWRGRYQIYLRIDDTTDYLIVNYTSPTYITSGGWGVTSYQSTHSFNVNATIPSSASLQDAQLKVVTWPETKPDAGSSWAIVPARSGLANFWAVSQISVSNTYISYDYVGTQISTGRVKWEAKGQ